jgi:DNA polymerase elongation subunit (family B)
MYQSIFYDRKASMVHLWDDERGYVKVKHKPYAYRKKAGGKYKSIYGQELEKVEKYHPRDSSLLESDVPVETRFLIDAYEDSDEISKNHRLAILDIEVDSSQGYPNIEKPEQTITAIAVYSGEENKYYCFVLDEEEEVKSGQMFGAEVISYYREEDLLRGFLKVWRKINPTIATGWNIDGFDFPYLHARLLKLFGEDVAGMLSPIGICYFNQFKNKMTVAGINCLDYLLLYKRYSQKNLPNYRLDSVAQEELKEGKIEYEGSLHELKRTDIKKFIEYNIHDIILVKKFDEKLQFIELAMSICHVCHVGYEEFHVSSKFLEGAMLTYLRRKNLVAPNKPAFIKHDEGGDTDDDDDNDVGFEGAYVKDPIPGRYPWVCSADINSLYPSVIMSLNISPETKIGVIPGWSTEKYVKRCDEKVVFDGEGKRCDI